MSYLQVDNLVKRYGSGEASVMALRGVSFRIQSGELIAINGRIGLGEIHPFIDHGGFKTLQPRGPTG